MSRKISHRFFIHASQIEYPVALLTGPDVNHIKNVLRLKPGDPIWLVDDTGAEYASQINAVSSHRIDVEIIEKVDKNAESPVHISIAQSYLKEKKMDLLIRQLTELGINYWCPFFSERSIPNPVQERLALRYQRWQKITIEAVKQCSRSRLMEIGQALSFNEMLLSAKNSDLKIIFWENAAKSIKLTNLFPEKQNIRSIFAVMGPEGGFSRNEINQAAKEGFQPIRIGPRILRAETATIAACAILQYM
jgi:16S rRNA (uracil1498-N3)-methyltransferase